MASKAHFFRQSGGGGLSLVAEYNFNNNLIDEIGGNNGTGTNISYNVGSFGNEAVFNGSTSEVRTPNSTVWDISDGINDIPIKIEVVINFGGGANQYVITKSPSRNVGWEIIKFGTIVYINIYDNVTGGFIQVGCPFVTDTNGYSNIVVSYDGTGLVDGLEMSINGINTGLVKNSSNYNKTSAFNVETFFGRVQNRSDRKLNGTISQIKLYK